ncbi:MAG: peptide/nickel transport system substrate-binding protein [Thermomicrobiales bacterium]|nr:peptide/nickel transport system substrate-binding protein [Thermomicrobiales bacterium]
MADTNNWKLSRRNLVKTGAALAAVTPFVGAPGVVAQDVKDVPRNRQLVLRWGGVDGRHADFDLWNGYPVGANHQNGLGLLHEPLAFYSAFADKMIPWLAESWEYNADFTELRITTRAGITWSDGKPFSAEDVTYTINTLRDLGAKVRWGVDVQQFVTEAVTESETSALIKFKVPAPRFFYFITYKYDIGVYIVPKHIFDGQDWTTFKNFDLAAGLPVTTGPWQVVFGSPEQKVIDRRDSWWAVDQKLVGALPAVERIIYLPQTAEEQMAQQLISNEVDCSLDLRPLTMETVLAQNPKITTHTGNEPPFGYVDWWPTSLYVNYEKAPYDDPDVRWALSYYIDRQQIIDVALGGAGSTYPLPLPSYPGLQPFVESVSDLLQQYPTLEFSPDKGDALLEGKGWAKNGDGIWAKDGTVLDVPIESFQVMADIGPVIAEQLRRAGVQSSFAMPPDFLNRFTDPEGDYNAALFGHGGSVSGDPYFTLRLYQTATEKVPGAHLVNFSKWENKDYDTIVDEMYVTSPENQTALTDQFHRAMEIWLPALPDIQIQEWYHRIPMNQTYWTGWPTAENPYVNGAFWHLTFQLILNELKAAQ